MSNITAYNEISYSVQVSLSTWDGATYLDNSDTDYHTLKYEQNHTWNARYIGGYILAVKSGEEVTRYAVKPNSVVKIYETYIDSYTDEVEHPTKINPIKSEESPATGDSIIFKNKTNYDIEVCISKWGEFWGDTGWSWVSRHSEDSWGHRSDSRGYIMGLGVYVGRDDFYAIEANQCYFYEESGDLHVEGTGGTVPVLRSYTTKREAARESTAGQSMSKKREDPEQ